MADAPRSLPITVIARDRLSQMFYRQRALQKHLHGGVDPATFEPQKRSDYIRTQVLALVAELMESLDEVAWKPWSANKTKFNREAFIRELVDAQHFLVNLGIAADVTDEEFWEAFVAKNDVNWQRHFEHKYDNSNKCPCGRALDDYPGQNVTIQEITYHSLKCEARAANLDAMKTRVFGEQA